MTYEEKVLQEFKQKFPYYWSEWVEEFDKDLCVVTPKMKNKMEEIKSFISSALKKQREEIEEEINQKWAFMHEGERNHRALMFIQNMQNRISNQH